MNSEFSLSMLASIVNIGLGTGAIFMMIALAQSAKTTSQHARMYGITSGFLFVCGLFSSAWLSWHRQFASASVINFLLVIGYGLYYSLRAGQRRPGETFALVLLTGLSVFLANIYVLMWAASKLSA